MSYGRIVIELLPTSTPGQYQLGMSYENIPEGWPAVHEALLAALEQALVQMVGSPSGAKSTLYQRMLAVLREFAHTVQQVRAGAPVIHRATKMPEELS